MIYIPGTSPARSWQRMTRFDIALLLAFVGFGAWFLWRAMALTPHTWEWGAMGPYLFYRDAAGQWQGGMLIRGLCATLRLGLWAMLLALASGGLVGVLSAHQRGLAALPATLYVNLLRNTPPLVLLFFLFFFAGTLFTAPLSHLENMVAAWPPAARSLFASLFAPPGQIDRMTAAVLTLGLYEGAYVAEIVRAGIESVPKNQWEAAASQGFSRWQQLRHVIAPQAFRLMLPPLAGQTISTFKDTALASAISLPELTFQSLEVMAVTRMTFELWLTTAALYLALSYVWFAVSVWLEKRQHWRPLA